jgi:flagellar hook assembly protein FlgD
VDVNGRKVRQLAYGAMAAGAHATPWDGRNDLGHNVPGGIYWAALEVDGEVLTRKVSVIH